jgi:hypothetical protein
LNSRAAKKGSVDEGEYLKQEEQVKKERAGSGEHESTPSFRKL